MGGPARRASRRAAPIRGGRRCGVPTGRSSTTGTPAAASVRGRSDARQHEQVCGANGAGRQDDAVGGQIAAARRARRQSTPTARRPANRMPHGPGLLEHRQIRSRSVAGPRKAPPGPTRVPPSMFSGTAPTPGGVPAPSPLRSAIQSITRSARRHQRKLTAPSSNSATRRISIGPSAPCSGPSKSRSVSIARKCGSTSAHVQPGDSPAVEVGGQPAAEVAAVDRAGAADDRAPHDRRRAPRACRSASSRSAGRPSWPARSAAAVPSLIWLAMAGSDGPGTRFDDRDPARGITRKPLGKNTSRATGTDDQYVNVQGDAFRSGSAV